MKLSKVKFLDASNSQVLTKEEQKVILGGYDGPFCCFYATGGTEYGCTTNPSFAESEAGGTYKTWACNTDEARKHCGC